MVLMEIKVFVELSLKMDRQTPSDPTPDVSELTSQCLDICKKQYTSSQPPVETKVKVCWCRLSGLDMRSPCSPKTLIEAKATHL